MGLLEDFIDYKQLVSHIGYAIKTIMQIVGISGMWYVLADETPKRYDLTEENYWLINTLFKLWLYGHTVLTISAVIQT